MLYAVDAAPASAALAVGAAPVGAPLATLDSVLAVRGGGGQRMAHGGTMNEARREAAAAAGRAWSEACGSSEVASGGGGMGGCVTTLVLLRSLPAAPIFSTRNALHAWLSGAFKSVVDLDDVDVRLVTVAAPHRNSRFFVNDLVVARRELVAGASMDACKCVADDDYGGGVRAGAAGAAADGDHGDVAWYLRASAAYVARVNEEARTLDLRVLGRYMPLRDVPMNFVEHTSYPKPSGDAFLRFPRTAHGHCCMILFEREAARLLPLGARATLVSADYFMESVFQQRFLKPDGPLRTRNGNWRGGQHPVAAWADLWAADKIAQRTERAESACARELVDRNKV